MLVAILDKTSMGDIVLDTSASNLVSALEANLLAHVPLYSHLPGAITYNDPEVLGLLTDLDPSESCVYRVAFTPEQIDKKIERVLQRFCTQHCLPMFWQVGPFTLPVDMGKHLEAQGFRFFVRAPGMAINLLKLEKESTISGNLVIERVRTAN